EVDIYQCRVLVAHINEYITLMYDGILRHYVIMGHHGRGTYLLGTGVYCLPRSIQKSEIFVKHDNVHNAHGCLNRSAITSSYNTAPGVKCGRCGSCFTHTRRRYAEGRQQGASECRQVALRPRRILILAPSFDLHLVAGVYFVALGNPNLTVVSTGKLLRVCVSCTHIGMVEQVKGHTIRVIFEIAVCRRLHIGGDSLRLRSRRCEHDPRIPLVISDTILILKCTALLHYSSLRRAEEIQRPIRVHEATHVVRHLFKGLAGVIVLHPELVASRIIKIRYYPP